MRVFMLLYSNCFVDITNIHYVTLHVNFIINKLGYYKLYKNATNMQDMLFTFSLNTVHLPSICSSAQLFTQTYEQQIPFCIYGVHTTSHSYTLSSDIFNYAH